MESKTLDILKFMRKAFTSNSPKVTCDLVCMLMSHDASLNVKKNDAVLYNLWLAYVCFSVVSMYAAL